MVAQLSNFAASVFSQLSGPARANAEPDYRILDHTIKSDDAHLFEQELAARVVGQDRALRALAEIHQVYQASLNTPGRPIGTLLFLGPTGTGKTRSVEAAAEVLFGNATAFVRVDCGEFQHPHEISKLIGAPPGYLGHRETPPLLSQENIDSFQTDRARLTLVLFDEIEKASDALWQLLLGVLDKATLTLGDNRRVDFSRTIIVMTSNLGAREMERLAEEPLGFACARHQARTTPDKQLYRAGLDAARRKFSPEFMNRLDKIVVFHRLSDDSMMKILELELRAVQRRILELNQGRFVMRYTDRARCFLLDKGTSPRYGARELKRTIEHNVVLPLSNLIATKQISEGDILLAELAEDASGLIFMKRHVRETLPDLSAFRLDALGGVATAVRAAR
ncbi:MAG TPA: AAA family ATPase [Blastocatellia bacterium]|nr:AAA family ATPase [Blastocatellia bacterium]